MTYPKGGTSNDKLTIRLICPRIYAKVSAYTILTLNKVNKTLRTIDYSIIT